jgi:hypothetical protein
MRHKKPKKGRLREHKLIIVMGAILIVLYGAAGYKGLHPKPARRQASAQPVPVYYARVEDAMPLPPSLDPGTFSRPDIREAYAVAKEIPDVLVQMPCYCYCQRQGHRGLLDCFKTEHAATCNICIKEALLAGRLHREGKSVAQIREAIIQGQWAQAGTSS